MPLHVGFSSLPKCRKLLPLLFLFFVTCLTPTLRVSGFAAPSPVSHIDRFKRLQNQFDLRGTALASNDGSKEVTLSPREAYFLGQAFATWIIRELSPQSSASTSAETLPITIAAGRDSRLTGPALSYSFLEGVETVCGAAAPVDLGLCSTPATFHACLDPPLGLGVSASVMVTASHLPMDRNGFKMFSRQGKGGLTEAEVSDVVALAAEIFQDQHGAYPNLDIPTTRPHPHWLKAHRFLQDVYGEHLSQLIRNCAAKGQNFEKPLEGMRVVLNPVNGAGGFFVHVLEACGADTRGSFNLAPDGHFPNEPPNPEDPATMRATVQAVAAAGADLGVILDPDCDRVGLVSGVGKAAGGDRALIALNRNRLIAMAAAVVLRDHPGSTIVTDSVTSEGLSRFIAKRGGKHLRYQKGYRNVIEKGESLPDCWLAMECSGHAAFRENRFLDDGAFLAVKLIGEMASPVSALTGGKDIAVFTPSAGFEGANLLALIADLDEPVEYVEIRLPVLRGRDREVAIEQVLKAFEWVVSVTSWWKMEKYNYEGLRAKVQEGGGRKAGWLHFRASLHDPVISLTCESEVEGGVAAMLGTLIDCGMPDATSDTVDWASAVQYLRGRRGPRSL